MGNRIVNYDPTPTQHAFIESDAVVNVIYSNTGEGKTHACIAAMLRHQQRCGVPIRCAIVRDTLENIKTSIVDSVHDFFKGDSTAYKFRDEYKELTINTPMPITARLFGIDDPGSLSKLQGPEYALIWLNEPAPMVTAAGRWSAGLSEEVFNAALVRCARQKGTKARLQVDMNPADEDHWTFRRFLEDTFIDPEYPLITKRVFRIPYGENIHASEISRQAAKAAYKDDPASYARYVLGQFAAVYRGPKVTPQYSRSRHLAHDKDGNPVPLAPAPGLESFAFFDSWSNPSCVLGQITQYNRLIYLDTLRLLGADVRTLLETMVVPLLESPRWKKKAKAWRIGGDCTMMNMDQSNKLMSAARVVESFFPGCGFEPGPSTWQLKKQHLPSALRATDFRGEPMILLSGDNRLLDKGLAGAWHYRLNSSGEKMGSVPEKDEASHYCDAFADSVCVLLPSKISILPKRGPRDQAVKSLQRARAYATGGTRG